jgi:uncharacterized protein YdaT
MQTIESKNTANRNGLISQKVEKIKAQMREVASQGRRVHVISHDKGWAVKREGAKRADRIFDNKIDAITRAKSSRTATDVVIHRADGTIERWEKPLRIQSP